MIIDILFAFISVILFVICSYVVYIFEIFILYMFLNFIIFVLVCIPPKFIIVQKAIKILNACSEFLHKLL